MIFSFMLINHIENNMKINWIATALILSLIWSSLESIYECPHNKAPEIGQAPIIPW